MLISKAAADALPIVIVSPTLMPRTSANLRNTAPFATGSTVLVATVNVTPPRAASSTSTEPFAAAGGAGGAGCAGAVSGWTSSVNGGRVGGGGARVTGRDVGGGPRVASDGDGPSQTLFGSPLHGHDRVPHRDGPGGSGRVAAGGGDCGGRVGPGSGAVSASGSCVDVVDVDVDEDEDDDEVLELVEGVEGLVVEGLVVEEVAAVVAVVGALVVVASVVAATVLVETPPLLTMPLPSVGARGYRRA